MILGAKEANRLEEIFLPCYYLIEIHGNLSHVNVIFFLSQTSFENWIDYMNSKCTGFCGHYHYRFLEVSKTYMTAYEIYENTIANGLLNHLKDNEFEYLQ